MVECRSAEAGPSIFFFNYMEDWSGVRLVPIAVVGTEVISIGQRRGGALLAGAEVRLGSNDRYGMMRCSMIFLLTWVCLVCVLA